MEIDKNLAYDIGAFTGDTVEMLKSLGYNNVVCFEPHPGAFATMQNRWSGHSEVVCVNKAVSRTSGDKVKMIVDPAHPYLNSLEESWVSIDRHNMNAQNRQECIVETISLDDYIRKDGKIPAYIKVDAEGHELEIFASLSYKPDMLSFEWITDFNEKNAKCIDMLENIGFTSFQICYGEATPTFHGEKYTAENCKAKLKELHETDTERKIWGNIWCL
jgi:FkbM family methyltransferase